MGNGRSIRVWEDAWLPDEGNSYVKSSRVEGIENLKGADLILENKMWDFDFIDAIFINRDQLLILSAPLSHRMVEDEIDLET